MEKNTHVTQLTFMVWSFKQMSGLTIETNGKQYMFTLWVMGKPLLLIYQPNLGNV